MTLELMVGWVAPVLALAWSASGRDVERAAMRWTRVDEHCAHVADGDSDELHSPPVFLEGRDEGVVFLSLLIVFLVVS